MPDPSPVPRATPRQAVKAVVAAVAASLLFVAAFVLPGHDPKPHGLSVVQVDAPPRLVAALEEDEVDVTALDSRAAAVRAIRDRDAYAAVVPAGEDRSELLLATGASPAAATNLSATAAQADVRVGADLAPLPDGDRRGTTLNLLVLPLIVTAIIGALMSITMLPRLSAAGRVALTALTGVVTGLGSIGLLHRLDALPGSYLAASGLVALMVMGVALTAGALIRALGPPALGLAFLLFLVIGNSSSGLASAPEMLPTPWSEVGALLPPGALGSALRGTAWFDGAALTGPVAVLVSWVVLAAGAHVLLDRRRPRAQVTAPAQAAPPALAVAA